MNSNERRRNHRLKSMNHGKLFESFMSLRGKPVPSFSKQSFVRLVVALNHFVELDDERPWAGVFCKFDVTMALHFTVERRERDQNDLARFVKILPALDKKNRIGLAQLHEHEQNYEMYVLLLDLNTITDADEIAEILVSKAEELREKSQTYEKAHAMWQAIKEHERDGKSFRVTLVDRGESMDVSFAGFT